MPDRRGPFWDVLEGRLPPPPAAVLLGWVVATATASALVRRASD